MASILSTLYEDGILKLDELHLKYAPSKYIKLQKGEFTERIKIKDLGFIVNVYHTLKVNFSSALSTSLFY